MKIHRELDNLSASLFFLQISKTGGALCFLESYYNLTVTWFLNDREYHWLFQSSNLFYTFKILQFK
jgi:hypothetical protein